MAISTGGVMLFVGMATCVIDREIKLCIVRRVGVSYNIVAESKRNKDDKKDDITNR